MNKQNSVGIENQLSTEINESTKSYSSRFKQMKAIKSNSKCRYPDVLPFRLEKAAIVIQKFWRLRQVLKKKVYEQLLEQLDKSNQILEFQNNRIDGLIEIYQNNCVQLQEYFEASGRSAVQKIEKDSNHMIKQMAIMTFKIQKKIIDESEVNALFDQLEEWKQKNKLLAKEKQQLKNKLGGQLQSEEETFLRKIKEENANLLRASKQKCEAEKLMREKLIETYKSGIKF